MNILFVTGEFARNERDRALGGMACAVYKSALGMVRLGHNVRILTVDNRDRKWKYQGIEVISISARNGLGESGIFSSLYNIWKRERKIEKTIQQLNNEKAIDIIQYTGWFGIGLFHYSNIPAIMRISSYTKLQLVHNYSRSKRFLLESVEYLSAKRMNFVFAPSKIMAVGMEKDIKKKVGIIETPFFQETVELDDCLIQTKLKDKKYILFFGRMTVDKGILVIRDILYKTLDRHQDLYIVFAGGSSPINGVPIETELINASQNYKQRVIFLGMLSKDKLIPVIEHSEMVLIPSLADNFPNSCAEAMSLGKIVIGTDGSSLEQFIQNTENGFLAEIGSPDSLYNCINYVLSMDDAQKKKMSEQAKNRIKQLDLNQYSKRMEMLYKKVINRYKTAVMTNEKFVV